MYKIIGADQKEYGPISAEVLRQWITEGRVSAQTRVQAEGSEEWKTLAQLPEFGLILPAPVPPTLAAAAPAPPSSNNPMAIWAFGVSIFSLFCCQFIGGIVALVLGLIALSQFKKEPNREGKGFAIAAVIIGGLSLIIGVVLSLFYFSFFSETFKHGFPR